MLLLPDRPRLRNLITGADEAARIVELTASVAHVRIDQRWWNSAGVPRSILEEQPDATWKHWATIAAQDSDAYVCVACMTADKQAQGAMLYWNDSHSFIDPGLRATEVLLLATAPHNREIGGAPPRYRGVGSALLMRAVAHSYLLDWGGRTVLTAKPTQATLRFYARRGFKSLSAGADGKIRMELEPSHALQWLQT